MLLIVAAACSRASRDAAPFNPATTVTPVLQTLTSDQQLAALAAKRGRNIETRQLAAAFERNVQAIRGELSAIAQRRKLPAAPPLQEKQTALRENLEILPGRVFDQGYALAMVQDMTSLSATFEQLDDSDDAELKQFAGKHRPTIAQQLAESKKLLDLLGGSPFGFTP
jgi:predicted outer membrane protein